MNLLNVLLQVPAGDSITAVAGAVATEGKTMNLWDMMLKGGWVMIPIFLLLLLAVYVLIERFIAIKASTKEDPTFMNRIKDYIYDGKIDSAVNLCHQTNTPAARMIEKGITRLGRPMEDVLVATENVGNIEISKLEKGLPVLASVAGGAPMLGFFGTVTGMVRAFYDMSKAGDALNMSVLSAGIYEAMVTTVGGLFVGIIAYFSYNYLVARVSSAISKMETQTMEFLDILNEPAK
jgi:biopolymer transport protein ExbB